MIQNNVAIIWVCHNMDIVYSILNNSIKNNHYIMFVGNQHISDELVSNPRIIVARNLPDNIEHEQDLLTFTAWYAIIKNFLFLNYEYITILEYDAHIENNFEQELIQKCQMRTHDVISFVYFEGAFNIDTNLNIMQFFLKKKGASYKNIDKWFATTNHCIKMHILRDFVYWYYPDCLEIKKLDPVKISWYHERLFTSYLDVKSISSGHLNLLSHQFCDSHGYMHNKTNLSSDLIDNYIDNPNCEFLNKFIEHYDFFLKLNLDFKVHIGSYLCSEFSYTYTYKNYEKQKVLFESAKTYENVLLIGNYMGHIAFIMLMANPNIKITCIDTHENQKYISLIESYFKTNISFFISNNQDEINKQIHDLNHDFDFIFISQQYPHRHYLNICIDSCVNKTNLKEVTFMIDDYYVYSNELIENINSNNLNCEISNDKFIYHYVGFITAKKFVIRLKSKKYLLVYDDDTNEYKSHIDTLVNSVKKYDNSFEVIIYNKKDIDNDFFSTNRYILDQFKGGGYWLWKPYIINETLKKIGPNDILFYIDSKYYFTENFGELCKPLLNQDFLVWRNKPNEDSYFLKNWCKMDIIEKYNIFDNVFNQNMEICWAGAILMRKTDQVVNIVEEWLQMCSSSDITDSPSIVPNSSEFIDHRHDQSLLSIVLSKCNIPLHNFPKRFLQNVRQPY